MSLLVFILICTALAAPITSAAPPLADVHVHYKWNQEEVTSPQAAVDTLRAHNVELAVVIGTPAEFALRLERLAPAIVVPVWSPYRTPGDWSGWAFDKSVPQRARRALASGNYRGIGELHLIGGFAPPAQSAVIKALADIAAEFDVPLLLHTEFSSPSYLLQLCRAHPDTRFVWAHAGAILTADQVAVVLDACANVWAELAARDPWRFINHPITDAGPALLPAWRRLIESYPDRFMIGSDTVWPVDNLDSWDQADTGWREYHRFIEFHRGWLGRLPGVLAEKIRLENARKVYAH